MKKKLSIQQQFQAEEARSAQFLQKLTNIKTQNKQSKQRTVINQQKLEWIKQMKTYLKRERQLEDELNAFLSDNPAIKVECKSKEATSSVRERLLKSHQLPPESQDKTKSSIDEPKAIGFQFDEDAQDDVSHQSSELTAAYSRQESSLAKFEDPDYFTTFDPLTDDLFSIRQLQKDLYEEKHRRDEFGDNLIESVKGVKQLLGNLKIMTAQPKEGGGSGILKQPKTFSDDDIFEAKMKVNELINDVQQSMGKMEHSFAEEASECRASLAVHKKGLSLMKGFEEGSVRGFDIEASEWSVFTSEQEVDDSIENLQIYSKFLGESEFAAIRDNYYRALDVMKQLGEIEIERVKMNCPIAWADLQDLVGADVLARFQGVHEWFSRSGISREKYMQRVELEFKEDMKRAQIDLMDQFFEHKRWAKQKMKAINRDNLRDRLGLKERTVKMIEAQVEDQKQKLQADIRQIQQDHKKEDLHGKLAAQKKEFMARLKIIEEIKREKASQEAAEKRKKEEAAKQKAIENKNVAQAFQNQKKAEKVSSLRQQEEQEMKRRRLLEEQIRLNKGKVDERQHQEMVKMQDRIMLMEEQKAAPLRQEERLNKAVEGYSFRPQVEIDRERVQQETMGRAIRKQTELDKADQVKLFSNPGFTSDKLMQDVRYKISSALHDAGLQQSQYANELLRGVGAGVQQPKVQSNQGTKGLF